MAVTSLEALSVETYLPMYEAVRQWSDRVVKTRVPLFPGYLFCRFDISKRASVLRAPGVVAIVGFAGEPAAVPDSEVESVRVLLASGLPATPAAHFREGERVRIDSGALEGVEGTLVKVKGTSRLVVSISLLQRSVTVEIDPEWTGIRRITQAAGR